MDTIFQGLFDANAASVIDIADFLLCIGGALVLGLVIAFFYRYKNKYTGSFLATLIMLPAIVAVVIMMVNGNIGAGVAVAGAFSLVRFRSAPGSAKDIATIFLAMGTGLICGMGYLAYAALFTVIMGVVMMLIQTYGMGQGGLSSMRRMKVTIPEDLDYTTVFDDILDKYASHYELVKAKSSAMGSLFKLTYDITLKDPVAEKEMVDMIRCRNGNLEVSVMKQGYVSDAL